MHASHDFQEHNTSDIFPITAEYITRSLPGGCKAVTRTSISTTGQATHVQPCSSPPTMAEALGIASSIVALTEVSWTIFEYLKDVKEASKEHHSLSMELLGLVHWLDEVEPLTDMAESNDLWLVMMEQLSGPVMRLTMLLNDLTKEFELALSGTYRTMEKATEPGTEKVKGGLSEKVKAVKHRLLWKFKKESVEDALKKMERIKSLMIVAVQHDHL